MKAIEYDKNFEIFNIGGGISYSVKEIVDTIKNLIKFDINVKYSDEKRKNDIFDTVENIHKAKDILNWQPEYDITSGIKEMLINYGLL